MGSQKGCRGEGHGRLNRWTPHSNKSREIGRPGTAACPTRDGHHTERRVRHDKMRVPALNPWAWSRREAATDGIACCARVKCIWRCFAVTGPSKGV